MRQILTAIFIGVLTAAMLGECAGIAVAQSKGDLLEQLLGSKMTRREHHPTAFSTALNALVKSQARDPKASWSNTAERWFLHWDEGRAVEIRSDGIRYIVCILGYESGFTSGPARQQLVLISEDGDFLDELSCEINSRYGGLRTETMSPPGDDGAHLVIAFGRRKRHRPGSWHNWHRIVSQGESYLFQEKANLQPPEWDDKGLCRVGVRDGRFIVVFPELWPRPSGSGLEFRLVPHAPAAERAERHVSELVKHGQKAANRLLTERQWFETRRTAPEFALKAEYQGRKYVHLCNVPWYTMLPHSTGPEGKSWGLKRVYVTRSAAGNPAVAYELDESGMRALEPFRDYGSAAIIAVLVDGKVFAMMAASAVVSGQGIIDAGFTQEEALALVDALRIGMVSELDTRVPSQDIAPK